MLGEWKKQNTAKKGMVDRRGDLKGAKKTKNCSTYSKIKGTKGILWIYIDYIDCTTFLVNFFYLY